MPLVRAVLIVIVLVSGTASQYGGGVAERTIAVRQQTDPPRVSMTLPQELPETDGYLAVLECEHIGEVWWLRNVKTGDVRSFLVIDCSGHAATRNWMLRGNIIGEIDWQSALAWDTVGYGIEVERVLLSLHESY